MSNGGGSFRRRILGIGFATVESADNLLLQPVGFCDVFSGDHALGQRAQLFRTERTILRHLPGKFCDLDLFSSWQTFDFFNDFSRRHILRLRMLALPCKLVETRSPAGLRQPSAALKG